MKISTYFAKHLLSKLQQSQMKYLSSIKEKVQQDDWLFSLLKSSAISLTAKSIWNGAICSRRMRRCLMRNNCPSNGVWTNDKHRCRVYLFILARRILTAVPQSDWRRPVGRPHSSWMATLKNDLSPHNLAFEDAIEMALDKPLWGLLAASGATHWWCMPNNDHDDDESVLHKNMNWHHHYQRLLLFST